MEILDPQIELKDYLFSRIYSALQGNVVNWIVDKAEYMTDDEDWREHVNGNFMKLDEHLLPDYFHLCQDIQRTLGLDEPVEYYVTGNASINAYSVLAQKKGHPHLVVVNSALFNLMTKDELKFVIGHELGHIIGRDLIIRRLLHYVYPPQTTALPLALGYKVRLFDQLAELVADRFGYIACGSLDACVTAFFKMESGLSLERMNVCTGDLLNDSKRRLDFFLNGKGMSRYDHPENPIRVQAIDAYATSTTQEELDARMKILIRILHKVGDCPINEPLTIFFATAGLMTAKADGKYLPSEKEQIVRQLASTDMYPMDILQDFENIPDEQVIRLFEKSVNEILNYDFNMRVNLLSYIIHLAIIDKKLDEKEINFIYNVGDMMKFTDKEISRIFADMIQRNYIPSLESIC